MGGATGTNGSKAKVTGNDTLLGQIATFMDSLHLSYEEVVCRIPYQNLIMMNADKLKVLYGEEGENEVEKISGREMLRQKKGG